MLLLFHLFIFFTLPFLLRKIFHFNSFTFGFLCNLFTWSFIYRYNVKCPFNTWICWCKHCTHTHTQQFIPFVNIISTKFSQEETYSNQICKLGVSMFTQQILYTVHLLGWVPESNYHCKFTAEYQLILNSNPSVIVKHFYNFRIYLFPTTHTIWKLDLLHIHPWSMRAKSNCCKVRHDHFSLKNLFWQNNHIHLLPYMAKVMFATKTSWQSVINWWNLILFL